MTRALALLALALLLTACGSIPGPVVGRLHTDTGQCIEALRDPMGWFSFRECQAAKK